MLVWGEKAPNRADRTPRPRTATWPDPSRSASLPVGKRTSPSSAKVLRSDCVTVTFARTAMSPMPVAAPSTNREVESWGLADAPPKKRSEEHTSELQSHHDLVCRLLLEKKKKKKNTRYNKT